MKPRYYQQESHDAAWNHLRYSPGSPVIVLPTGAGKSLVIAMLVEQAREYDARVIVLQHRKELIQQNAEKIQILLPDIPIGINSAGLKTRDYDHDVICAGIQSVYRDAEKFGRRELIVIDEVHLVGDNDSSMYGKFLHGIRELNPKSRLVGLTATPYRTGEGVVCGPEKLFQEICYESQTGRLIEEKYLCPITNKTAEEEIDTSEIKVRGGEFVPGEAEKAFDTDANVVAACRETIAKCAGRKSILVFAAGVSHAEHITDALQKFTGEEVGLIVGDTFPMLREKHLSDFRDGKLRWLVNCNVLTTGFDAPCIDAIAVLRATMSPGLFAQIVGRGLRRHETKDDCIAEGQQVLTNHGLVEIQNVTKAMRVWDGIDFVEHGGTVLRGEQFVVEYAGLTATEDHNVWTEKGWMPFAEARRATEAIAITGNGGQAIRKSENRFTGNHSGCHDARQAVCDYEMRGVWSSEAERDAQCSGREGWMSEVRSKTKFRQALSRCSKVVVAAVYFCKRQMHKSKFKIVEKLRRPWDHIRFCVSQLARSIFNGSLQSKTAFTNRQNRQRQGLLCWQPALCYLEGEYEQSAGSKGDRTKAQVQVTTPGNKIRRQYADEIVKEHDIHPGGEEVSPEIRQTKRVWDIVNAGPRHRFTCQGLLVSNCLILDFGENIKRHGSLDDPEYGRDEVSADDGEGEGDTKSCPNCQNDVSIGYKTCPECGFRFITDEKPKHETEADEHSLLTGNQGPEDWVVSSVSWSRHEKRGLAEGAPPTLRIDYYCQPEGGNLGNLTEERISEWVCVEHTAFARTKARAWWEAHSNAPMPDTVDEAIWALDNKACRMPLFITTQQEGRWKRIRHVEFDVEKPDLGAVAGPAETFTDDDVPF